MTTLSGFRRAAVLVAIVALVNCRRGAIPEASADQVVLTNTSGSGNGILVDGQSGNTALVYQSFQSAANSINVGTVSASSQNEVVAFTNLRPVAIVAPAWTAGSDTVNVPFANQISIPITVWIVKGPYRTQYQKSLSRCITTKGIWDGERMGVAASSCADVVDATANPNAANYFAFDCTKQTSLQKDIGQNAGRVNIYVVDTVQAGGSFGVGKGQSCGIGTNFVALGSAVSDDLAVHELGHGFGLTHIDALTTNFDDTNVMHSASVDRQFFTEGQLFRAHLSPGSTLNAVYAARSGQPTRDCPRDRSDNQCPAIHKRIWPDGSFPEN